MFNFRVVVVASNASHSTFIIVTDSGSPSFSATPLDLAWIWPRSGLDSDLALEFCSGLTLQAVLVGYLTYINSVHCDFSSIPPQHLTQTFMPNASSFQESTTKATQGINAILMKQGGLRCEWKWMVFLNVATKEED